MRFSVLGRPAVLLLIVTSSALGGCTDVFPSFAGPFGVGSSVEYLPVSRVTARVACELRDFISNYESKIALDKNLELRLDPDQAASASLTLQTDHTGSVQYTGVDLSKLGLTSLANLITTTKGVPSLSAKVQPKSTILAQIDISIPQKPEPHYVKKQHIPGLNQICHEDPSVQNPLTKLYLAEWLEAFFNKTEEDDKYFQHNLKYVCLQKITLKTSFTIAVDISAGANPFFGAAYLLPINGITLDYNPDLVHSLQIVLVLTKNSNSDLCSKSAQPNVTASLSSP